MATLTIRLPDDQHQRLKAIAKQRHVSVSRLMEEFSARAIAEFDSEVHFRALAASGHPARGLKLLDKLDRAHEDTGP
jgi:predicted transcriptional regulator